MGKLLVAEFCYARSAFLPRHSHSKAAFCCTLAGAYDERYGRRSFESSEKQVVFRPAGEAHTDHFGARVESRPFLVEIPSGWLDRTWSQGFVSSEPKSWDSIRVRGLLAQVYREFRADDPTSSLAVEGLVWQLIAETARQTPRRKAGRRKLEVVREILHEHFSDCPTLSDLAEIAGIHPTHLSRSFHARFGCTISRYVQQRRAEFAWKQLIETNKPIVEIALQAGFAHQAHFSTAFKCQTGKTPAEVRMLRERPRRAANSA